ncbi:MAG: MATE family efflux transporter [Deltaproteobacteria bacterium]
MPFFPAATRLLLKESWSISWPMTLIMFFDFILGLTDIFVAGRIGTGIQASYGIAFQVYFIFLTIAMAFTIGTVSVVSRLYSSGKEQEYCTCVYSSLVSTLALGLFFGLAGFTVGPFLIAGLHIPAEIKAFAIPMIKIYSAALCFDYLLTNSNGILRSSDRILVSLRTMTIVAVVNVILCFLLAFATPLGYKGIAWAMVISTFLGFAINSLTLRRMLSGARVFSLRMALRMADIGWPMALLQFLWQSASMAIYSILGNLPAARVETMAAFTNGLRIESAVFLPAFAFNMANAVLVGNRMGKGRTQEAYHNGIVTAWLGASIVAALTLLVILCAPLIMPLLTSDTAVARAGITYLRIAFLTEPMMAWGVILSGGLSAAGDTRIIMMIVALSLWVVRIPLAYLLCIRLGLGPVSVWWAMNASIVLQSLFMSNRYFGKKWLITKE